MSDLPQHVTHLSTSLTSVCCLSTSLTSAHQTYLGMSDSPQRISFNSACQTHLRSMSDSPQQHTRLTSAPQTHLNTSDSPQHITLASACQTHLSTSLTSAHHTCLSMSDSPQHITHLSTSHLPQYVRLTSVHQTHLSTPLTSACQTHLRTSDSPQHIRLTSVHQTCLSMSDLPECIRLTSVHRSPQHVRLTSARQTRLSASDSPLSTSDSPQHVMKGDLPAGVQLLNLVAHVLEEQAALLRVHLQAPLQQAQQEPHPARRYHTLQNVRSPCTSTAAERTTRGTSGRSEQSPESFWAKYMDLPVHPQQLSALREALRGVLNRAQSPFGQNTRTTSPRLFFVKDASQVLLCKVFHSTVQLYCQVSVQLLEECFLEPKYTHHTFMPIMKHH